MPAIVASAGPLYMGFDLSTQQLKGLVVQSDLKLVHEAKVDFDADLSGYGTEKGVLTNAAEGEVFAPVTMWLEAVDLVLERLKQSGLDFSTVRGISGAGMQHGTVFWSHEAEVLLGSLDASRSLVEQLAPGSEGERKGAFAHPYSPNWQDASTQTQCDAFDAELGSAESLADIAGSKAHHRFSGPQILRFHTKYPSHYAETARISLVSSFLASIFLGRVAPLDIGDVCGMNLWDMRAGRWDERLLALAAGKDGAGSLQARLGDVPHDGGASFGAVGKYFVQRHGFPADCAIIPFTGDNPATILALPLRASDAMVSLGTSTTFLMSTPLYKPDPAYHFMNHPCTPGLYMFMLCYKNGGLAREQIRDTLNSSATHPSSWDTFNDTVLATPPISQGSENDEMRLGLYFPRPEIVPNLHAGQWRFGYNPVTNELRELPTEKVPDDARNIVESQMLSLRLRSQNLVVEQKAVSGASLPAQPRRVYLVGGGSANPAIARVAGEVLGGIEGVYKLDIGSNACALGAAYKAVWGSERAPGETFEDLISSRWDEASFVKRVADGYTPGVFEKYGDAVTGFDMMERLVLGREGELRGRGDGGAVMDGTEGEGAAAVAQT